MLHRTNFSTEIKQFLYFVLIEYSLKMEKRKKKFNAVVICTL